MRNVGRRNEQIVPFARQSFVSAFAAELIVVGGEFVLKRHEYEVANSECAVNRF